ncbi:MAG: hypothetical protein JJT88_06095 [Gammaproteobacteria bacterium]|nr:hypothetical protein [Gammaproteobacteria bacterium]
MTTGQTRAIKVIAIVLAVYVGIVVVFESLLGYFQPEGGNTVVITTTADGRSHDRVLTLLERGDELYVAANHWPRAWYKRALDNPEVQLTMNGERADYRAVLMTGSEHDRIAEEFAVGLFFRFLTGFPPRYFVRLDPVAAPPAGATDDAVPSQDAEAWDEAEAMADV